MFHLLQLLLHFYSLHIPHFKFPQFTFLALLSSFPLYLCKFTLLSLHLCKFIFSHFLSHLMISSMPVQLLYVLLDDDALDDLIVSLNPFYFIISLTFYILLSIRSVVSIRFQCTHRLNHFIHFCLHILIHALCWFHFCNFHLFIILILVLLFASVPFV